MKTAVILAAGKGTKIWPYSTVRPKAMIPVANRPVISFNVNTLIEEGFTNIIVIAGQIKEQIKNYFSGNENVKVICDAFPGKGTAFTLLSAKEYIREEKFLVLYADTIISRQDLHSLIKTAEKNEACVLAESIDQDSAAEFICLLSEHDFATDICAHPRRGFESRFCAFALNAKMFRYFENNSGIFTSVNVGVMPPLEGYIEMSLLDYINSEGKIYVVHCSSIFIDIDKPWHILEANKYIVDLLCRELDGNILGKDSFIDPEADIKGFVKLGNNSFIGKRTVIRGSLIAGDNVVIDNGAIIEGNVVIGNNCTIRNYCQIGGGSAVGDRCIIEHCAQFSGVIFERVHLYHYMEYWGVIGACTDLGAATVCGTLRFDDGKTIHNVKGKREIPANYSNASYLGDYSRTGVNAILMPGCKTGAYSIVGPGVILNEDLPENTIIMLEQSLVKKEWGPSRYGW